ncbi:hypothetical protein SAICODRAFT_30505 [Saitoella complicata NRRL Y-17804]|uniref:uncharacterized protein n=1 Tax=Saitoella complicata (strain BCRC 22490 / CBS 7301 / JCM 7358 / NBRC 10748 / NRRL Y-17804) TaxID=698492 RepID=UPI000867926B|nr:uncharacterized protein SAICODRAFT_30505 [Saitoella complicata NRRL Y-17804]ODQ52670.1 hypothetical protein SAICODRAFT_30505 [Saitoella complicata NRRL Y-17804]
MSTPGAGSCLMLVVVSGYGPFSFKGSLQHIAHRESCPVWGVVARTSTTTTDIEWRDQHGDGEWDLKELPSC